MNELRIALILIGLGALAGIYFWGTRARSGKRKKRPDGRGSLRRGEPTIPMPKPTPSQDAEAPVDVTRTLSDLSDLVAGSEHATGRPGRIRAILARVQETLGSWSGLARQAGRRLGRKARTTPSKPEKSGSELILLYVVAPPGRDFTGHAIRDAAEDLGMRYGEMKIFHHPGVGRLSSPAGLYCLANMLEPGSFDLNTLVSCRTEGLVLIMRLPAPVEARLCFELMLHGAYRLAEALDGEVRDGERRPLSPAELARLRAVVAHA